jgi:hypothetical protein
MCKESLYYVIIIKFEIRSLFYHLLSQTSLSFLKQTNNLLNMFIGYVSTFTLKTETLQKYVQFS